MADNQVLFEDEVLDAAGAIVYGCAVAGVVTALVTLAVSLFALAGNVTAVRAQPKRWAQQHKITRLTSTRVFAHAHGPPSQDPSAPQGKKRVEPISPDHPQ